ncbi:hypothetical protein [Lentilitoribacter sp. Alg239-R112]|uniref:hypothetical protein n=1 Tax=Lentilitoribacter sp. Alg239-R112 TaxID=2305987 RepID=UPI0013A68898|nr:hypothetical protein [Lentilitoribacter sp. Alg239-R112]
MLKKRISVRGVDEEAIDMLNELRDEEGRFIGRILSDAIYEYRETRDDEDIAYEELS